MTPTLVVLAVAVSLAIATLLVYYLVRVIRALQSITNKLANARVLLLTVASQTEPVEGLVGGVAHNVSELHTLVTGVATSLGISTGARG